MTRRQFTPFGGTPDPSTQLENLGAREYDPANGRFLSADPVFEDTSPTQMGGYDYAGNDPITGSDPSGLFCDGCEYAGSGDNHGPGCSVPNPVCGNTGGYTPVTHFCDGCESGDVSHPELADLGRFISGQNKDINKQPYFGGLRIPTFDTLKKGLLGVGASVYKDGEYGLAIQDWARAECSAGVNEANTQFCGAATKSGLLHQGTWQEFLALLVNLAIIAVTGYLVGLALAPIFDTAAAAADGAVDDSVGSSILKGCNSFAAGTAVLTADGSQKPIQDVKIGDKITNADPDSKTSQQHTVTAIHVTDTDTDFTSLSVATAAGPKTVTVTAHHLFWDSTKHIWTTAADLKPGDQLDTGGNGTATVLSSWRFTSSIRTYNLTVDGLHTYYVLAGQTPVLVHNEACAVPRFEVSSDGTTTDLLNPNNTRVGVPELDGGTLQQVGARVWGHGDPTELVGTRGPEELRSLATLNDAKKLQDFYRSAELAGKGGKTAPARVQLTQEIIDAWGG